MQKNGSHQGGERGQSRIRKGLWRRREKSPKRVQRFAVWGSQSRKVQDAKAAATETPQKKERIDLPEVNRGGQEEQTKVDVLVSTRQKGDSMQKSRDRGEKSLQSIEE